MPNAREEFEAALMVERVASKAASKIEGDGDGAEFARLLDEDWNTVKYNKDGSGSCSMGGLKVTWRESGNESAVLVEFSDHFKTSAETAKKLLDEIKDVLNKYV